MQYTLSSFSLAISTFACSVVVLSSSNCLCMVESSALCSASLDMSRACQKRSWEVNLLCSISIPPFWNDKRNSFRLQNLWNFSTVWKFQDFSIILHEINFSESSSPKNTFCSILRVLYFANLGNFSHQQLQKFIKINIQSL